MRKVKLLLGPPGTGKTTTLINIVQSCIERGIQPERIGYFSFTRKATIEARTRAIEKFGYPEEMFPYFRTLHSLAFREMRIKRDEVMSDKHYRAFGKALGVEFKGIYDEDLGIHTGEGLGDKCSRIESLARIGMRSLEDQYHMTATDDLTLHAVKQYSESLKAYKSENGLYDFTDMLAAWHGALDVDVAIFDEAQDLSTLQFKMAIELSQNAKEVYLAGDDDQSIFQWAGSDLDFFLNMKADEKQVLSTSYRVPRSVHRLAVNVLGRIKNRYEKPYNPRTEEGKVDYIADENQIDLSKQGTWLLLARSRYLLGRLVKVARQQGYAYIHNGRSSTNNNETKAIQSWEEMRKGERISMHEAKNLLKFLNINHRLKKSADYGIESFGLPQDALKIDWMDMLRLIPPDEREYLRSCLRNNQSFNSPPRITISTIHQSKGGEADNVVLLTDCGRKSFEALGGDEENRVWYVGLTRCKENLFLVRPKGLRSFQI